MLNSYSQDVLDITIDRLTKSSLDHRNYQQKGTEKLPEKVINNSAKTMKLKFEKRLVEISIVQPASDKIKLSPNQDQFLKDCKKWLQKGINEPKYFDDDTFMAEFRWTETDDIFKGQHNGVSAHGHGICFNHQNDLIEGVFAHGKISHGLAKILYSNGEYYTGQVEHAGLKTGRGIYYYANSDIYDGQFIKDNRIGNSRLIFNDGSEYIGQFIVDEADGHGIFTDKQGNRYMSLAVETHSDSKNTDKGGFF
jgi:hypothetical protein